MKNWYRLLMLGAFMPFAVSFAQIASLPATFRLQSLNGVTVPFQGAIPSPTFEKQRRPAIDLAGEWRKQRFAANTAVTLGSRDSAGLAAVIAEAAGRHLASYDDSAWPVKKLPAVENTLNGFETKPETYESGVWYRRTFVVPDSLRGCAAVLKFLSVNYVADVWLNGRYLGYHEGGFTPFAFEASAALNYGATNVIAVRVENPEWGSRNDIVPYGTVNHRPDWFNYTGIIHDVYIEFPRSVSVARGEVIPQGVDGSVKFNGVLWNVAGVPAQAHLALEVFEAVVDSANVGTELSEDLIGARVLTVETGAVTVPAESVAAVTSSFAITSPRLWSPKHPNLYILRASAVVGNDTVDRLCTQFGVRTVTTKGRTLLLNGKPMFFPGVARHEDHYLYGRSVPKSIILSDLRKALDLNATFIRTAHYPNHPYTYLIADRLGMAVMEEIPIWWFDENDAWLKQDLLRHIHEQMWREMVFRDRSRPSILFWSTCNECLDQTNRQAFIQRLNTELDTQYPDGRLVTESAAADRPGPTDPTQDVCDLAGWTMYFGIFHGSTYYGGTRWFMQVAQLAHPSLPILDTEFGYWSTESQSEAPKQVTVFDSTFKAFNEFVAVDSTGVYHPDRSLATTTWWALFDWFTAITGNQTMGLYRMDHERIKPVAAHLRDTYRAFKNASENAVMEVAEPTGTLPTEFQLHQNYPNPFNPSTNVSWDLPVECHVHVVVYDVLGRQVAELLNSIQSAGSHLTQWDASRLASGVYFLAIRATGKTHEWVQTRPMMLIR
jgi:beta-galactosidase